jgi:hypothetical protein
MTSATAVLVRLWVWALAVRVLKHVAPLEWLIEAARPAARSRPPRLAMVGALRQLLTSRQRFPARAPGNCLDRSLAAYRLLCLAGAAPRLTIGVRHHDGSLDGHVWVVVDGRPFAEADDFVGRFAPVLSVDADGTRTPAGAAAPRVRFA